MILSFHPNIVAHRNRLCAGRAPNEEDAQAISDADAIILPQGPSEALYRLCKQHCEHVFPNLDVRFDYPGKLRQVSLFRKLNVPFPVTHSFASVAVFRNHHGHTCPLPFPCVFKSDWGDEGREVFLVDGPGALQKHLQRAEALEGGGQKGFLMQEYVPHGGRCLRVVVIGNQCHSYWRRQTDPSQLLASIRAGAVIDVTSDPHLQEIGKKAVSRLCEETGTNLAGFDILFSHDSKETVPLLLEINFFFGRRGLGGSEKYYKLLDNAVDAWLQERGLQLP